MPCAHVILTKNVSLANFIKAYTHENIYVKIQISLTLKFYDIISDIIDKNLSNANLECEVNTRTHNIMSNLLCTWEFF
jgi:hypothetical protein